MFVNHALGLPKIPSLGPSSSPILRIGDCPKCPLKFSLGLGSIWGVENRRFPVTRVTRFPSLCIVTSRQSPMKSSLNRTKKKLSIYPNLSRSIVLSVELQIKAFNDLLRHSASNIGHGVAGLKDGTYFLAQDWGYEWFNIIFNGHCNYKWIKMV